MSEPLDSRTDTLAQIPSPIKPSYLYSLLPTHLGTLTAACPLTYLDTHTPHPPGHPYTIHSLVHHPAYPYPGPLTPSHTPGHPHCHISETTCPLPSLLDTHVPACPLTHKLTHPSWAPLTHTLRLPCTLLPTHLHSYIAPGHQHSYFPHIFQSTPLHSRASAPRHLQVLLATLLHTTNTLTPTHQTPAHLGTFLPASPTQWGTCTPTSGYPHTWAFAHP